MKPSTLPDFELESAAFSQGYQWIAGVDEVGRGCLAGPVIAAAVILDSQNLPQGLNDSKKLAEKKRNELVPHIIECSHAYAIAHAEIQEIDTINILQATFLAMRRSVSLLKQKPDYILVDGSLSPKFTQAHQTVIKGDTKSLSIAAAAILAKVFRDQWMKAYENIFPGYALGQNKGYGSKSHRKNLQAVGPTLLHRKSFKWKAV